MDNGESKLHYKTERLCNCIKETGFYKLIPLDIICLLSQCRSKRIFYTDTINSVDLIAWFFLTNSFETQIRSSKVYRAPDVNPMRDNQTVSKILIVSVHGKMIFSIWLTLNDKIKFAPVHMKKKCLGQCLTAYSSLIHISIFLEQTARRKGKGEKRQKRLQIVQSTLSLTWS